MRSKRLKIAMVKTWICRNKEGKKRLDKAYQTFHQELKDQRKQGTWEF